MESIGQGLTDDDLVVFLDLVVQHELRLWNDVEPAVSSVTGVRLGSFQALRMVAQHEGRGRVADVATDLGVTVGAASKIVDRLVDRELVVRRPHSSDGRSSTLAVTAAGRAALTAGSAAMAEVLRSHLDGRLTAAEQQTAVALLRRLATPIRQTVAAS